MWRLILIFDNWTISRSSHADRRQVLTPNDIQGGPSARSASICMLCGNAERERPGALTRSKTAVDVAGDQVAFAGSSFEITRNAPVTATGVKQHSASARQKARGTGARAAWAGLMIAMLATSTGARGDNTAPRTDGPFNALEWADGVTTARNGYAVWISVASTRHRVRIPDHRREAGPPEHGVAPHVSCRAAGGGLPEVFPPAPAPGGIYLDNHPGQPGAYTVLHPMHWILGLSGRDEERWPVEVRMGAGPPVASALVRPRIDCSAPGPGLDIKLPGEKIIDAIMAASPIEIEVEGPQMRLTAEFTASANARRAAALMREACPQPPDGRGARGNLSEGG